MTNSVLSGHCMDLLFGRIFFFWEIIFLRGTYTFVRDFHPNFKSYNHGLKVLRCLGIHTKLITDKKVVHHLTLSMKHTGNFKMSGHKCLMHGNQENKERTRLFCNRIRKLRPKRFHKIDPRWLPHILTVALVTVATLGGTQTTEAQQQVQSQNTFEHFRTLSNTFEHFRTLSNTFEHFWTLLNTFERFRTLSNAFKHFWTLLNRFVKQNFVPELFGDLGRFSANKLAFFSKTMLWSVF
jgi:hypothetical protein